MKLILKSRLFAVAVFFTLTAIAMGMIASMNEIVPHVYFNENKGVVDLTEFDFASSIAHIEEAEFYPGQLIHPSDLKNAKPSNKEFDNTAKYNTAVVHLLVPDGDYIIFGVSPEYASRIYINAILTRSFGYIDESDDKNNIYQVAPYSAAARPAGGVLEVVTQVAGIVRDNPSYSGFYIGKYNIAEKQQLYNMAYQLIPVVIAVVSAFLYFGFFIFNPDAKANLWFALISLTTGFFLFRNGKLAYILSPALNYEFEYFGRYISLLLIGVFYVLFVRALFRIHKAVTIAVCSLGGVFFILFLSLPIKTSAQYLPLFMVFTFSVMAVCAFFIIKKIKSLNPEQFISFFGQAVFMMSCVFDMIKGTVSVQVAFMLDSVFYMFKWTIFGQAVRLLSFAFNALGVKVVEKAATFMPEIVFDMLGATLEFEFPIITPIGIQVFLFVQMAALYLANNRAVENEQRLVAENSVLEKQGKWKTEMLGNLSHELKTPLTVISNVSQLARLRSSEDYVRGKLDIAVNEVERMKLTVSHILEISRLEDTEPRWDFEPVDIKELINDTVSNYFLVMNEHNNELIIRCSEALPKVKADAQHIVKVLVNLIYNAVRFTHDGYIIVSADYTEGANAVEVSVEDTGSGIMPEQREHIFDRFYTGDKSTGTGLGLYICKGILDAHGGEINIESEPGKGTMASFTLLVWEDDKNE